MFDLSKVLDGVSEINTELKQIEYIPLELIDPDPNNFYSLDGLNELAGNIELIGLQQPLVVRSGEGRRVTVVSGHRRRAAIMLIRDGGSTMFDQGVPCIREIGECSAALQELRLIYANSATRVLSASEISKQAERVTALLYELKEQGVEFPGRMRDHVAQACQVSKSKLGRLHAIRKNLAEPLLAAFDEGSLNEAAAYELQKLPMEAQLAIAEAAEAKKGIGAIRGDCAARCADKAELYMKEADCPNAPSCNHHLLRFVKTATSVSGYDYCTGGCCKSCFGIENCKYKCAIAVKTLADRKAEAKEKARREAEIEAQRQTKLKAEIRKNAQRLLPLIEAAGLSDDLNLCPQLPYCANTPKKVRAMAAGEFDEDQSFNYSDLFVPYNAAGIKLMAGYLNCSTDFILGLSDEPRPVPNQDTKSTWQTGYPDHDCLVAGRFDCGGLASGAIIKSIVRYDASYRQFYLEASRQPIEAKCVGWVELPEED